MFLAGADDAFVSRFLALYVNESASGVRQPPVIELGPALQQAAHSAGVEVARELVRQFESASSSTPSPVPVAAVPMKPASRVAAGQLQPTLGTGPSDLGASGASGASGGSVAPEYTFKGSGLLKPYAITVSGHRTSVTLPVDLIEIAHRLLGEKGTREFVAQNHALAPVVRTKGKKPRANFSGYVRTRLEQEVSAVLQRQHLAQLPPVAGAVH